MADLRDLIYRQRNRRAGRSAPITRSPGVREMPFGTGATAAPQPTNPYNAPVLSAPEREVARPYTHPLNPDPYDKGVPPPPRDFGGTETAAPKATAPAPVFGANVSSQEKYLRDDLDAYYAKRKELAGKPIDDDDSKLHNFGAGAAHAMRQVQRTGNSQADLGATLGALTFGGLRGLFTKKEDDIRDRQKQLGEIDKEIEGREKGIDKSRADRIKEADYRLKGIQTEKAAMDYLRAANKPFYDSITADDQVTEEEASDASRRGFGEIKPYDNRKIVEETVNGEKVFRRGNDPNYQKNPSIDVDKTKVPIAQTLKDGTVVYVTGSTALDKEIAEAYRQAQMNADTEKFNVNQSNEFNESLTKWRDDVTTKGAKVSALDNELAGLLDQQDDEGRGGGADNFDPTKITAEIAKKKGELSAAKQEYNGAMKNPPKPSGKLSTQNITTGRYKDMRFTMNDTLRSRFKGKSDEAIRQLIKSNGGSID